jgi:integrase
MRDVAILTFATELRQAHLLRFEWSQVDLVKRRAWIHLDQAKARRPIDVLLNAEAAEAIRHPLGRHNTGCRLVAVGAQLAPQLLAAA